MTERGSPPPRVTPGEVLDRALLDMLDGPVTPSNEADVPELISLLNDLLATAVVCWLRGQQYGTVVAGVHRQPVAELLLSNADSELQYVRALADRINQLGGTPNLDPGRIGERSHASFRDYPATDPGAMLKESLLAVRVVIQICQESVRWIAAADPTSRRLLERILEAKEREAGELRSLLRDNL